MELAELGLVAPREIPPDQWQIPATALPRLRVVGALMRDLGVNVSGACWRWSCSKLSASSSGVSTPSSGS